MASTITLSGDWLINMGSRTMTRGTGNLGTYTSGGIAVTAAQVGLGLIDEMIVNPAGGYIFEYVKTTGKVKAYLAPDPGGAGGADVALSEVGSVDLSGTTFRFAAVGQ